MVPQRRLASACSALARITTSYSWPTAAKPELVLPATVIRIVDGGTVDVRLSTGPTRVRLYGIDTPERSQPFGAAAASYLTTMIKCQQAELPLVSQDAYDRIVGVVYMVDTNVNA